MVLTQVFLHLAMASSFGMTNAVDDLNTTEEQLQQKWRLGMKASTTPLAIPEPSVHLVSAGRRFSRIIDAFHLGIVLLGIVYNLRSEQLVPCPAAWL